MEREEFITVCGDKRFWKWIRSQSLVSYGRLPKKEPFLADLFKKIESRMYNPSPPREYLTLNKGNGVIRVIPVLQLEDLCVYYFCVRKLETYIAVNRVPNTFGGFGLSGKLRKVEEDEIGDILKKHVTVTLGEDTYVFDTSTGYGELSILNPNAWYAEWNDFTKKLYFKSADFQDGYVAELDISNFYDSIQLDHLEFKLRKYIPNTENEVIYLLLHFLRYWNRHINFYRQQGAGIPQDLFGECSRVLANFYLQDYDSTIAHFCTINSGKFFRYADDQIIFAQSREDLERMIVKASSLLMRHGLNFNQKKVKIMEVEEFQQYYTFENFLLLASKDGKPVSSRTLSTQINFYLKNKSRLRKSGTSLLKRIMSILLKVSKRPKNFATLKQHLISEEFLLEAPLRESDLSRIYQLLNGREKARMNRMLMSTVGTCLYTDRLYKLKRFFSMIGKPVKEIDARIRELKKFYGLH